MPPSQTYFIVGNDDIQLLLVGEPKYTTYRFLVRHVVGTEENKSPVEADQGQEEKGTGRLSITTHSRTVG